MTSSWSYTAGRFFDIIEYMPGRGVTGFFFNPSVVKFFLNII